MRHKSEWHDLPKTVVICAPCRAARKRRVLLKFDLGPDGPAQIPYTDHGEKVLPRWSGPEDGGKVHRTCSCGNHVQVSRGEITKARADGVRILYR